MTLKFILEELKDTVFRTESLIREISENDRPDIDTGICETTSPAQDSIPRGHTSRPLDGEPVREPESGGKDTERDASNATVGLRYNEGKLPLEMVAPEVTVSIAQVTAVGMEKYSKRNWEKGMSWMTIVGCLLRHLTKWLMGEDKDAESGLSHLDHLLWNAQALVVYERRGIGTDDRPKTARWPEANDGPEGK